MHHEYVLASANRGKLYEMTARLKPLGYELRAQAEWQVPPVKETGATFVENALLKARHAARITGLPCIADDSGLVVPALNGAPGIFSARYAGSRAGGSADRANIQHLLEKLEGVSGEGRQAYFYCCLVLLSAADDPAPLLASARWHGIILHTPRGENGFGYDPVFGVDEPGGERISAAEMAPQDKQRVSHRGLALSSLLGQLREPDGTRC